MKIIKALPLICFLAFLTACNYNSDPQDPWDAVAQTRLTDAQSTAANELRTKIGLPVIDEGWLLYRTSPTQEDWKKRNSDAVMKSVLLDAAEDISSEQNSYYSGSKYLDSEGEGFEEIVVTYSYQFRTIGIDYLGTNAAYKSVLKPFAKPATTANIEPAIAAVKSITRTWHGLENE